MTQPNLKRDSVLFLGCGDLGNRAGSTLLADHFVVAGARRDVTCLPESFVSIAVDYTKEEDLGRVSEFSPTYVVASFKPLSPDPEGYHQGFLQAATKLRRALATNPPRRTFFVSSTRVFAEQAGGWVDEDSPRSELDSRAVSMIEAEGELRKLGPTTAIYFAGLYGASAGRLLSRIRRGELGPDHPPRYSNRIHRIDAGDFIAHLIRADRDGASLAPGYIGCDNEPAVQADVERWLAEKLGVTSSTVSAVAKGPQGHKRCNNARLRESGFELQYPDFRSGYGALIQAG